MMIDSKGLDIFRAEFTEEFQLFAGRYGETNKDLAVQSGCEMNLFEAGQLKKGELQMGQLQADQLHS